MSKLLLVEDNQLNRDMLSRRLERKGYQVVMAGDGQEAVAKAQAEAPDLILMDMSLPVLDGWEATRRVKATPATRSIPVIALTAHAMVGDREKTLAAGCDDYETKPVDLPRLLGKIEAFLQKAREKRPEAPAEQPFSLLVVDDNENNRDVLARRLERHGYQVTLAQSGAEAMECLQRRPFDLVLLDVMMPETSGLEVLRMIRASHSILQLPVILVTAKDQGEDVVQGLRVGANDYVTKPLNFPVVLARIQTQLAMRKAHLAAGADAPAAPPKKPTTAATSAPSQAAPRPAGAGPAPAALANGHAPRQEARAADPPPDKGRVGGTLRHSEAPGRGDSGGAEPAARGRPGPDGYEVLEELSRGEAPVYKARDERAGRLVALKVLDKGRLTGAGAVDRLRREVQAAAQLSHPNIATAYDVGRWDDAYFVATEYVEGTNLGQLVQQGGPLPVGEACHYVRQAARALHHAFEHGLVHGAIQPSSLLVASTPAATSQGGDVLKVLDLGVAPPHQPTESAEAAGAPGREGPADYTAPEQWMNAQETDTRADLYSLGCTFYYLLTGQVPFPGDEPMEKMLKHHLDEPEPLERLRPEVPPKVAAIVGRLLAKKPEHRFQQPRELAEALA